MKIFTTHNLTNPFVNGKIKLTCKGPTLHIKKLSILYNKKKQNYSQGGGGLHYYDWNGWNDQSQTTSLMET
jgi:hypothetical protein